MITKKKAVIYCRTSSWQQAAGSSIPRQLENCVRYAATHGYTAEAVFTEIRSGTGELPIRRDAEKLAAKIGAVLLCESIDRWTRRTLREDPLPNSLLKVVFNDAATLAEKLSTTVDKS